MPSLPQGTQRILEGLRVIDLTTMIAGPTAGRIFAELGADVIHVEPPQGDDGRNTTTTFLGAEGSIYSVGNRSKRGVVIDIRNSSGRELLERLASNADLFVENMTPGVLLRLGLGYERLASANPRLIQLSISGWGATGPLSREPGYEVVIQAYVGAMQSPSPGAIPRGPGVLLGDATAPLLGTMVALAALRECTRTGRGMHITSSVLQGALFQLGGQQSIATSVEREESPEHSGELNARFKANDGRWVCIVARTSAEVSALRAVIGAADNGTPAAEEVGAWVGQRPAEDAVALCRAGGVPAVAVREGVAELLQEAEEEGTAITVAVDHPEKGRLWTVGSHFELEGVPLTPRGPAPLLGQHTREVLHETGLASSELDALEHEGAIVSMRAAQEAGGTP